MTQIKVLRPIGCIEVDKKTLSPELVAFIRKHAYACKDPDATEDDDFSFYDIDALVDQATNEPDLFFDPKEAPSEAVVTELNELFNVMRQHNAWWLRWH
jgi:hypothetical protein